MWIERPGVLKDTQKAAIAIAFKDGPGQRV